MSKQQNSSSPATATAAPVLYQEDTPGERAFREEMRKADGSIVVKGPLTGLSDERAIAIVGEEFQGKFLYSLTLDTLSTGIEKWVSALPKLNPSQLTISNTRIYDNTAEKLEEALVSPKLRLSGLTLNDSELTDKGASALLAALDTNKKIEQIIIPKESPVSQPLRDQIRSKLAANIIENFFGKKSDTFYLREQYIDENAGNKLVELLTSPEREVKSLHLGYGEITVAGMRALSAGLAAGAGLEVLYIEHNQFNEAVIESLVDAIASPGCKLKSLYLFSSEITVSAMRALSAGLAAGAGLEVLNINGNRFNDTVVELLVEAIASPKCKLKKLSAETCGRGTELTTAAIRKLAAALAAGANLEELQINARQQKDSAVETLAEAFTSPQCKLKKLYLSDSYHYAADITQLSSVLAAGAKLEELTINAREIGDGAVETLAEALTSPQCKLKVLEFKSRYNTPLKLSDSSASAILAALDNNTTIEVIKFNSSVSALLQDQINAKLAANKRERETGIKAEDTTTLTIPQPPVRQTTTSSAHKAETPPSAPANAFTPPPLQQQLSEDTIGRLRNFAKSTLAEASPETVAYLKRQGDNGVQAEREYARIREDAHLSSYYDHFNRSLSSAVSACSTIHSKMVKDDRTTMAEDILGLVNSAAQGSSIPALPLVTGMAQFIAGQVNNHQRKTMVNHVSSRFPTPQHHAIIEMTARQLTLEQQEKIIAASEQPRKGIIERTKAAVRWLQADDTDTPVKALAALQAASLLDKMMQTSATKAADIQDIPQLVQWAKGSEHIMSASSPVAVQMLSSPQPIAEPKHGVIPDTKADKDEVEELRRQLATEKALREANDQRLRSLEESMKKLTPQSPTTSVDSGRMKQELMSKNGTIGQGKNAVSEQDFISLATRVAYQDQALQEVITVVTAVHEDVRYSPEVRTVESDDSSSLHSRKSLAKSHRDRQEQRQSKGGECCNIS